MTKIKYRILILPVILTAILLSCEFFGFDPEYASERTSMHTFEVTNKADSSLTIIFYDGYSSLYTGSGSSSLGSTLTYQDINTTVAPGSKINSESNVLFGNDLSDKFDYNFENSQYSYLTTTLWDGSFIADETRNFNFNGSIYIVENYDNDVNYTAINLAEYNFILAEGKYYDFILEITGNSSSGYQIVEISKEERDPEELPETVGTVIDLNYTDPEED